jgi:hypothetical protein
MMTAWESAVGEAAMVARNLQARKRKRPKKRPRAKKRRLLLVGG